MPKNSMDYRALFGEIENNPDSFVSWLKSGDPDLTEGNMELIGGVGAAILGLGPGATPLTRTAVFLEKSDTVADHLHERQTFIEGYRTFEAISSAGVLPAIRGIRDGVERRTHASLVRRRHSLVGAFTLWKSDDNQLASYFDVSRALVQQSQIAASESGLIHRHNRYALGLRGKLRRIKPIEGEDLGQIVAQKILWEILPSPETVDSELRQLSAASHS